MTITASPGPSPGAWTETVAVSPEASAPPAGLTVAAPVTAACHRTGPPTARRVMVPLPPGPRVSRPGVTSSRPSPGAGARTFGRPPSSGLGGPAVARGPSGNVADTGRPTTGGSMGPGLGTRAWGAGTPPAAA